MSRSYLAALVAVIALAAPSAWAFPNCDAPTTCATGRQLQRCEECGSGQCQCWYKRTDASDLDCNGCDCSATLEVLASWCAQPVPAKDAGLGVGYGCDCSSAGGLAGAGVAALLSGAALRRRRRGPTRE